MVEISPDVLVPWWLLIYLLFVLILSGFTMAETLKEDHVAAISCVFSLISIILFSIAFFHKPLADFFGFFVIPIAIVGMSWEFTQAVKGTEKAQKILEDEQDLTEEERGLLVNAGIFLNALIVVPGYIMGLWLCYQFLSSFGGGV